MAGTGGTAGWGRRWVAGALGGALLLGAAGARMVPPPPPWLRTSPHPAAAKQAQAPQAPEPPPDPSQEPGAGPALIWLLPMAGQLSGAPAGSE